eukprot:scaffold3529_cov40-Phaeocystis_antarctica.AAC.2
MAIGSEARVARLRARARVRVGVQRFARLACQTFICIDLMPLPLRNSSRRSRHKLAMTWSVRVAANVSSAHLDEVEHEEHREVIEEGDADVADGARVEGDRVGLGSSGTVRLAARWHRGDT